MKFLLGALVGFLFGAWLADQARDIQTEFFSPR